MNFNPIVGKEDSPTVSEISQRPVEHRQAVVVFTGKGNKIEMLVQEHQTERL